MIVRGIVNWLDDRFGSNAAIRYFAKKIYPDHWSFYLGEYALYSFMLLVGTGVWLTFAYVPNEAEAYSSVVSLSRTAPIGYLVRQVHHWSAVTFVAAILVHMARIFFTAAFRKPRELNWLVGITLLVLSSIAGFTGYSLPNDALSGTGVRIADSILLALPLVGTWAANVLNGGNYPGPLLLPHLYTVHVYFLPVLIAILISLHLAMLIYQKHTQFVDDPTHVVGRRFWPDYALRTIAALAMTVTIIFALSASLEINPIEDFGPYHDWVVPNPAVPDWYAAFLDGSLRIGPALELTLFGHPIPAIFWPGVVMPIVVLTLVALWPWIDAWLASDRAKHDVLAKPTSAPWRVGFGVALIAGGIILTLAASDDQQAMALHVGITAIVTFYRIALPVGMLVCGLLAAAIAHELAERRALHGAERERVVDLYRNAHGGFDEKDAEPA